MTLYRKWRAYLLRSKSWTNDCEQKAGKFRWGQALCVGCIFRNLHCIFRKSFALPTFGITRAHGSIRGQWLNIFCGPPKFCCAQKFFIEHIIKKNIFPPKMYLHSTNLKIWRRQWARVFKIAGHFAKATLMAGARTFHKHTTCVSVQKYAAFPCSCSVEIKGLFQRHYQHPIRWRLKSESVT